MSTAPVSATPPGGAISALPRPIAPHPAAGWPHPISSFVGRDRELAALRRLLRQDGVRLVTLTGPGGVGKTRLALRVADELAGEYADGAAFVDLAPVSDVALVLPTIARGLGVRDVGDQPVAARLAAALAERDLLLLLDNLEQVVEADPALAALLAACPRLTVLATSRAVLRVAGEQVFPVLGFAAPDPHALPLAELSQSDAVALFAARAAAADPACALSDANAAAVAAICARLDGLPLAIELAAARSRLLAPDALLARLTDRFRLLTGGARDAPIRLRSLRDAVAWSYDLLPPEEQTLFRRLAVFAGDFGLDAAERVAEAFPSSEARVPRGDSTSSLGTPSVLDLLAGLIDANLLGRGEHAGGNPTGPRYRLLETVREYAQERLAAAGEEEPVHDAHAAWYLNLAEEVEAHLIGAARDGWLDRLDREHDNCRAALAWLRRRGDAERALRLAGALCHLWWWRGRYAEGRFQIDAALALPPSPASATGRAKALTAAGALARLHGDLPRATAAHEASLPLFRDVDDRAGLALAVLCLHQAAAASGDFRRAAALGADAVAASQALDVPQLKVWLLVQLGATAGDEGADQRAAPLLDDGLRLARALGDDASAARALIALADLALRRGEATRAAVLVAEAESLSAATIDRPAATAAAAAAARVALAAGDASGAADRFRRALVAAAEIGDRRLLLECLEGMALVETARGNAATAVLLLAASGANRAEIGMPLPPSARAEWERALATARAMLDEETFTAAWETGRVRAFDAAVAAALAPAAAQDDDPVATIHLTPREDQVLRLLVAGRADREIAAAMSISRRTAQGHVAAIFAKLGVRTRTAAATAAIAAGLVPPLA